jgi:hypothetical protein
MARGQPIAQAAGNNQAADTHVSAARFARNCGAVESEYAAMAVPISCELASIRRPAGARLNESCSQAGIADRKHGVGGSEIAQGTFEFRVGLKLKQYPNRDRQTIHAGRDLPLNFHPAAIWPAPGSEDTELGVFMGPEVSHGETKVYAGVQA